MLSIQDEAISTGMSASSPKLTPTRASLKVPEVTFLFWVVKLLSTALGESTSDFFVYHINPYLAVILGFGGIIVALIVQLCVRRYVVWVYWFAVVMVAVFGTMAADVTHVVLGVPYFASTATFAVVLSVVFVVWKRTEKTLSIHSVRSGRRELFYWAAVIATFALGTAAGDMTAATLRLGYFPSFVIFAVLFVLPFLARRFRGLGEIVTFWISYVMTRPLGASFADWMGKPFLGGLGLGDGKVAFVLAILIIAFVSWLSISGRRTRREVARTALG